VSRHDEIGRIERPGALLGRRAACHLFIERVVVHGTGHRLVHQRRRHALSPQPLLNTRRRLPPPKSRRGLGLRNGFVVEQSGRIEPIKRFPYLHCGAFPSTHAQLEFTAGAAAASERVQRPVGQCGYGVLMLQTAQLLGRNERPNSHGAGIGKYPGRNKELLPITEGEQEAARAPRRLPERGDMR